MRWKVNLQSRKWLFQWASKSLYASATT